MRKIKKFEACGLDWHTRDKRPLAETFKQEDTTLVDNIIFTLNLQTIDLHNI